MAPRSRLTQLGVYVAYAVGTFQYSTGWLGDYFEPAVAGSERYVLWNDGREADQSHAYFARSVLPSDSRREKCDNRVMSKIEIKTADGTCPSYAFRPSGPGPWPGVLVYMDGIGIRPAMLELGERLASHGYFVLVPDLFYRSGPYEPMDAKTVFSDPEKRKVLMEKFFALVTPAKIMSDTAAYLAYFAAEPSVTAGRIGAVGYCMGGLMALTAAGTYPDRCAAAASYHGGRLATDADDSPHRLASKMKSRVYVAGAIEDPSFPDDMKARLAEALTTAGVDHAIETYPAHHGWVFRDVPTYDESASARHWVSLLALFDATLNAG